MATITGLEPHQRRSLRLLGASVSSYRSMWMINSLHATHGPVYTSSNDSGMLNSNALTLEQWDTSLVSMSIEIARIGSSTSHRGTTYRRFWKGSVWRHPIPLATLSHQALKLCLPQTRKLRRHGTMRTHNWSDQSCMLPPSVDRIVET